MAHYNDLLGHFPNFLQNSLFVVGWGFQNGMQGHYKGYLQSVQQGKDVYTILATEYSKLMFKNANIRPA